jgi:hypothetical protein
MFRMYDMIEILCDHKWRFAYPKLIHLFSFEMIQVVRKESCMRSNQVIIAKYSRPLGQLPSCEGRYVQHQTAQKSFVSIFSLSSAFLFHFSFTWSSSESRANVLSRMNHIS